MRRSSPLVLAVMLACTIPLEGASARPLDLPTALFGVITAPIQAILGNAGRIGRGAHHRRPIKHRSRPAAVRPAGTAASATPLPLPKSKPTPTAAATSSPAIAEPDIGRAASAATAIAANASPNIVETAPIPKPAPRPRSTALNLPGADSMASGRTPPPASRGEPPAPASQSFPLGVVGPLAWPSAYEDVVGFTFWPQQYGERLRQHSIGDVMNTLFKPAALASRTRAEMKRVAATSSKADEAAGSAIGSCDGSETRTDWPKAQIEGAIRLTSVQRVPLDELGAAIGEATATIKTACRDEVAMPPVERVRALQNKLWTVRDAAILIRAPLAKFYDSLTDEQKKPLIVSMQPPPDLRALAASGPNADRDEILQMCGMSKSGEWPIRLIEQFLQPNAVQRASLENLQKKTFEMAQFLLVSCVQPVPPSPPARLDVAIDRLTAVIFATSQIGLALNELYNQLDDKQKAKIDSLGRQP